MTSPRIAALASNGRELLIAVAHGGPASGIYAASGGHLVQQQGGDLPTVLSLALRDGVAYAGTERGLWVRRGGIWAAQSDLGEQRVEQVAVAGGRVLARTAAAIFEEQGGRFAALPGPTAPGSLAVDGSDLWVAAGAALYRLHGASRQTVTAPAPGGQLARAGDELLLAGSSGLWSHRLRPAGGSVDGAGDDWRRRGAERWRLLETGDVDLPAVLVGEGGLRLVAASGELQPLELPFPARDVLAAAVFGGRLYLGTSGYGLISQPLPPAPGVGGATVRRRLARAVARV